MLSLAIRYLSFPLKKSQTILATPLFSAKLTPLNFRFSRSRSHIKKDAQAKQDNPAQNAQSLPEQAIKVRRQLQIMQQQRHKHGPECEHDHDHHHDSHHNGQYFKQNYSSTNQTPPNVKLSKLSFEQLMEINSEDSLKYAQTHYQNQQQNLKELVDFKEDQKKYVDYLKNAEVEIKEKEKKLEENIVDYEKQLKESQQRATKQIEEVKRQAIAQIAKEFVEVVDGIANCRKQAESIEKSDLYIDLILKTQEIIHKIMKQYQIEQFDPTDQPYDPNFQQSLTKIPTPQGAKSNHVAKTLQAGYKIQGRLLRSAKVSIFS